MPGRSKRGGQIYQIIVSGKPPHQVTAESFHHYITTGWLQRTGPATARTIRGVNAWLLAGELRLENIELNIGVSIPSSWKAWERESVFRAGGIREAGELQRETQKQYGPQSIKNEIARPDIESFGTLADLGSGGADGR